MDFGQIIAELNTFFQENKFVIFEVSEDMVIYNFKLVEVRIVYDFRDRSIVVFTGRTGSILNELDPGAVKNIFNCDLSLSNDGHFVKHLKGFLNGRGKGILEGDESIFKLLDGYSSAKSKMYTHNLVRSQYLRDADKAWKENNHRHYIIYIDKIDSNSLPSSYLMKYQIEKNKINPQ